MIKNTKKKKVSFVIYPPIQFSYRFERNARRIHEYNLYYRFLNEKKNIFDFNKKKKNEFKWKI